MRRITLLLFLFYFLQIAWFEGFNIKNVRLDKCIHANNENNKISLTECNPDSENQQWRWDSRINSIVSLKTKQCLTVHKANEFGAVKLEPCGSGQPQAWRCSKRGHLTLEGFSLHLSVKHKMNKVHVSHEKGKLSKWRTLKDKIICTEANHIWQHEGNHIDVSEAQAENVEKSTNIPMTNVSDSSFPTFENITLPKENDKTVRFKFIEGTTWKIAMLIMGAIALILGLIILTVNIIHNKKRKKLSAGIVADSADEKTSLTTGLKPQHDASRSPSLRHGEILIEWKDGKITPLFDDN
ncbi:uncharacterized protein si:dkey-245n4.2 [Heptranchias perlo]|uniref:uncharacterized protein si:dkey-245n4.2 n=1 Tax=Heptranchias perlo TaxID=212740 RepID=UPI00355A2238